MSNKTKYIILLATVGVEVSLVVWLTITTGIDIISGLALVGIAYILYVVIHGAYHNMKRGRPVYYIYEKGEK